MRDWRAWIRAAGVRAIKTIAQTAVATIGTSAVISEVNWLMVGSASLLAGILSLLTSVAGLPELDELLQPRCNFYATCGSVSFPGMEGKRPVNTGLYRSFRVVIPDS